MRNSGAHAVIEGCGSNGCEYMTGGVAVILGRIGANFGAGMTGGMAYVYDPNGVAEDFMNLESILTCGIGHPHWEAQLKGLIEAHVAETGSRIGARILADWEVEKRNFLQVCPKEMVSRLQMVAQIFANALDRKRTDQELREGEARLGLAADSAGAGLWSLDLASGTYWLTEKTRQIFDFPPDQSVTFEQFLALYCTESVQKSN